MWRTLRQIDWCRIETLRYAVTLARRHVSYQCRKDTAYYWGQKSIVSLPLCSMHCRQDHWERSTLSCHISPWAPKIHIRMNTVQEGTCILVVKCCLSRCERWLTVISFRPLRKVIVFSSKHRLWRVTSKMDLQSIPTFLTCQLKSQHKRKHSDYAH